MNAGPRDQPLLRTIKAIGVDAMKTRFVLVTMSLVICCWMPDSLATGPSHAHISIAPVAFNDKGVCLFKTRCLINLTGAHDFIKTEYGWLIVSVDGIWEEAPHITLDPEKLRARGRNEKELLHEFHKYDQEFDQDFNWASPPDSVRDILQKYAFHQPMRSGEQEISLARARLQNLFSRVPETEVYLKQRGIGGLSNFISRKTKIRIVFAHAGVIVIKNIDEEQKSAGEPFEIFNPRYLGDGVGCRDYGVEYQEIDGVIFIKPSRQ